MHCDSRLESAVVSARSISAREKQNPITKNCLTFMIGCGRILTYGWTKDERHTDIWSPRRVVPASSR